MQPRTVEVFGRKRKIGHWLVVNHSMTKVLGSGASPETALHKAGLKPYDSGKKRKRPVLMQVQDPTVMAFY